MSEHGGFRWDGGPWRALGWVGLGWDEMRWVRQGRRSRVLEIVTARLAGGRGEACCWC